MIDARAPAGRPRGPCAVHGHGVIIPHAMTLILTSVRPADVVITADGRSILWRNGQPDQINDRLQKIFPVPDHPLAIVHHGENLLEDKPVGEWITAAIRRLNAGNLTIEEVADELRGLFHPHVRRRLRATVKSGFGFGLIVAGFGVRAHEPMGMELWWKIVDGVLTSEERQWGPTSITPSGTGVKQIPAVSWREIADKDVDVVRVYHKELMNTAMWADVKPANTVGGHVHELVITQSGWKWTTPPKAPDKSPAK